MNRICFIYCNYLNSHNFWCLCYYLTYWNYLTAANVCLVPVNYFVTTLLDHLQTFGKPSTLVRAADFCLLLCCFFHLLWTICSEQRWTIAIKEMRAGVRQSWTHLISWLCLPVHFFCGTKLFLSTNPPKYPQYSYITGRQAFGHVLHSLSSQGQLIMDTKRVHSLKHCWGSLPQALLGSSTAGWVEIANYANHVLVHDAAMYPQRGKLIYRDTWR